MASLGGKREGAGRKSKADEDKLIQSLKIYDELARAKLIEGVTTGNYKFIELFYSYRYGKPKQQVDVTTNDESLNRVMIIPETIATQLLNDIPDDTKLDSLDNSEQENK